MIRKDRKKEQIYFFEIFSLSNTRSKESSNKRKKEKRNKNGNKRNI